MKISLTLIVSERERRRDEIERERERESREKADYNYMRYSGCPKGRYRACSMIDIRISRENLIPVNIYRGVLIFYPY